MILAAPERKVDLQCLDRLTLENVQSLPVRITLEQLALAAACKTAAML